MGNLNAKKSIDLEIGSLRAVESDWFSCCEDWAKEILLTATENARNNMAVMAGGEGSLLPIPPYAFKRVLAALHHYEDTDERCEAQENYWNSKLTKEQRQARAQG